MLKLKGNVTINFKNMFYWNSLNVSFCRSAKIIELKKFVNQEKITICHNFELTWMFFLAWNVGELQPKDLSHN